MKSAVAFSLINLRSYVLLKTQQTTQTILTETLLSFDGFVDIAATEQEMINLIAGDQLIDTVILNYSTLDTDTNMLIKKINGMNRKHKIPILLLAPVIKNEEIQKIENKKSVYTLTKPIKQNQLYDAIKMIIFKPKRGIEKYFSKHSPRSNDNFSQLVSIKDNVTILLTEDNEINQKVTLALLNKTGIKVDIAVNGKQAIEKIIQNKYELVLMDVQMPRMDGPTATRKIRRELGFKDLTIIAITAHAMKGDREKCLQAGMNDYISKPIEPNELYRVLAKWLVPVEING